jgi:hypothetical protein
MLASPPRKTAAPGNTLRRTSRMEFPPKATNVVDAPMPAKKKKAASPVGIRQKPKLIRNLGGVNTPKGKLSDLP